jgi:hypothetical protein
MIRVVQWTTGNVGTETLKAILRQPELELVGCYAWAEEKRSKDVGTLVGLEAVGIEATSDIDALLALAPDCVCYTPLWPDVDHLCRILEAGINVATSAHFITGHGYFGDERRRRIEAACHAGGSSILGSGMHPGFSNLLALTAANACNRIDKIVITESQDASGYASAETQRSVGFDHPIDTPNLAEMVRDGSLVFIDGLHMMADALGVELDEVRFEADFAAAAQDVDLGFMMIHEGHVGGVAGRWHGVVNGRVLFDVGFRWIMGGPVTKDWPIDHAYLLEVQGMPTLKLRLEIHPPPDFKPRNPLDYMQLGMVITGLPVVNAIPALCRAESGIRTYADLRMVTATGFCQES